MDIQFDLQTTEIVLIVSQQAGENINVVIAGMAQHSIAIAVRMVLAAEDLLLRVPHSGMMLDTNVGDRRAEVLRGAARIASDQLVGCVVAARRHDHAAAASPIADLLELHYRTNQTVRCRASIRSHRKNDWLVDQAIKTKSKSRAKVAQMGLGFGRDDDFCAGTRQSYKDVLPMAGIPDRAPPKIGYPLKARRLACASSEKGIHIVSHTLKLDDMRGGCSAAGDGVQIRGIYFARA